MKRLFLAAVLFMLTGIAVAQTETEPNNNFPTANTVEYDGNLTTEATLGSGDQEDNFRLPFEYAGNLYLEIAVTNTGGADPISLTVYNGLTFGPGQLDPQEIFSKLIGNGIIGAGETVYDTITVCGLAPDDYYLRFQSPGNFTYSFRWVPVNATEHDEPNNSFAAATPFFINTDKYASIHNEFWGNTDYDTVDYFKTLLPAADYSHVRLTLTGNYNGCSGTGSMQYFLYKNSSTIPFAFGYLGGNTAGNQYEQLSSIIPLSNMQQGDQLYVRFISSGPFFYKLKYKEYSPFEDEEPNGEIYQVTTTLAEGVPQNGNVGEYDDGNQEFIDQYDIYKLVLPNDGAVNIKVTATNLECGSNYYALTGEILDQYGSQLTSKDLITWDNDPACNETKSDSIKFRGIVAGTYYLRLYSDNGYHTRVNYTLKYTRADSTGNIDPEPNDNEALAIPIAPGEIKKGHLAFTGAVYDYGDVYKTVLPASGRLRVFIKSISRNDDQVATPVRVLTNGYSGRSLVSPPFSTLPPDSVFRDTIEFCGNAGGEIFFSVTPYYFSLKFEYEFSYAVTDTTSLFEDAEPNETFAQARLIGAGTTKKGRIAYRYADNNVYDYHDTYKAVFSVTDSFKLFLQATNQSCSPGNQSITVKGYNKNFTPIFSKTTSSVASGMTVIDSIKINVTAPDTIYFQIEKYDYPFNYQFTTGLRNPSSTFKIEGDSTVCHSTQIYKAINLAEENVTYNWSLPAGGGSITWVDSIATVVWNTDGNRTVQLVLSNAFGNSQIKTRSVIVSGAPPTAVPVAYNFARTLSTNSLPPGTNCQWFRNDTLIAGAVFQSYYAAQGGSYTVKFVDDCGDGPASNAIVFPADALPQAINFPHTSTVTMSATAKVILNASANSGLPVFYQKIDGGGYIQNDTLYIGGTNGVGQIIVKSSQPGDDVYLPAPDKYDTIEVVKGNQVISFDVIPPQILGPGSYAVNASTNQQQGVAYTIVSGNAVFALNSIYVNTNVFYMTGAGPVTVRVSQDGNANYNPATPVERTFCIGVRSITAITGDANPCLSTYRYNTQKINGANYVWTLSSGGILTSNKDTAWVQWQTPGNHSLSVKANTSCDPVFTNTQSISITTSANGPTPVTGMLPENNATELLLPLTLSWIPGNNTVSYDLYVWESTLPESTVPFAANIQDVSYIIPRNALVQNKFYKWKIVSKNPCTQIAGPVQIFKVLPSPDLTVSDVNLPATATSGQTITISWKVTNLGPGRTKPTETWNDGVYLSRDTIPNFNFPPLYDPSDWNNVVTNDHRPLLVGTPINATALDSGQFYVNSTTFTLPLAYSQNFYAYVIANNGHPNYRITQVSVANDTAHKAQPMVVTILPTPDLRTDTVTAPLSAFSGSTVNIGYKVKNYGVLTPAGSNWTDSVFLSQNPLFDRSQCIALRAPKFAGNYYANAPFASAGNSTQLVQNATYTKNIQAVIPNFIFGTWFVYVKNNATGSLYEGAFVNNNVGQAQMQIYLTPTPKLTVGTVNLPVTQASTTQTIGANWNIFNEGSYDNIEFNKGHILLPFGTCSVSCYSPITGYTTCVVTKVRDSLVRGSSYWKDRLYISRDSSALIIANATLLKEVDHGTQNAGLLLADFIESCGTQPGSVNVDNVINPNSNFPKNISFGIPDSLLPGNYYLYVYTNPTKTVYEYPGTPQIKRSTLPITVVRPDVIVSSVIAPTTVSGGVPVTVDYIIQNNGPGTVFNHLRKDRFYVSNFNSFDASATILETKTFTEDVPVGNVPHSFTYTFTPATSGTRYFYVHTNYDSAFKETNSLNNLSAARAIAVTAASPSDLILTSVIVPDTVFTLFKNVITYTVKNNGTGTTAGTWADSVYFSCNPIFGNGNNNFAGRKLQTRTLAAGESYTDTIQITIPKMSYEINACFPEVPNTTAYFFMKTNANGGTYEGTNINNNVLVAGSKILTNPLIDHIVVRVNAPDTTTVGRPYQTSWTLKNLGYNIDYYYNYFSDAVYFSPDSVFSNNAVRANAYLKYNRINRNDTLNDSKPVTTPNLPTGDYYVFVFSDYTGGITGERIRNNNINFIRNASGAAKKIHVIQPLLPDLTDSIISAPTSAATGQPITIIHKVTNKGVGPTYPGSWRHHLLLSTDFLVVPNDGDQNLSDKKFTGVLMPGQSYIDTITAQIRHSTPDGNYVLINNADGNREVAESQDNNNLSFSLLSVYHAPLSDLTAINIRNPDTVYLGYTIDTVKWAAVNYSSNPALGQTSDGIYLSKSNVLDSTALLIGIKNKTVNILPTDSLVSTLAPLVNNAAEGSYHLFVKTDILNNIPEANEENNTGMAATPVYVKVKELPLNVLVPNTLQRNPRYYKMIIPDSLIGSTIKVTLRSSDSLLVRNEMFIGGGYVPTAAHYDYRYETPNYGNQQIVMASVTDSVYYIVYNCITTTTPVQNVTLKAEKLPFAILNVNSATGGNIGNVTVKISGSLFTTGMTAKLSKPGTTITASAVYFTNSTAVYATFNLQGKPLGIYDVTLTKTDAAEATLASSFSVVTANNGGLITGSGANTGAGNGNEPGCDPGAASGLNSQLVVNMVIPPRVVLSHPFIIQINYSNPTNYDIPSQSRTLYNDGDMKMAFSRAGVPSGTTSLYMELTETGGPPGIIRAGGSGTITVYLTAPDRLIGDPKKLFRLQ